MRKTEKIALRKATRRASQNVGRRGRVKSLSFDGGTIVLCVDSDHDEVTKAGLEYRDLYVYPYLKSKGLTLTMRQRAMAKRAFVEPEALKPSTRYITGIGHGDYDLYTGYFLDPIFTKGLYAAAEVSEKIVHFLACKTARDLGPDFVKNGCRAYFGYDEPFSFQMKTSTVFFECDSVIDRGFADGLTAADIDRMTRALFDKYIDDWRANGEIYGAAILEFDRDHLKSPASDAIWGSQDAKLV